MAEKQTEPLFKPGDRVKIRHSQRSGLVYELRGPLGPGGAQIYRVRYGRKPKPAYVEVREDQLVLIPPERPGAAERGPLGAAVGRAVGRTFRYLNTDLDLTSADELGALADAFEARGVPPLHVTRGGDGLWYATFETEEDHTEPEPSIAAMLAVVESLAGRLRSAWDTCTRREFNIGYDCGAEPWAFNQALSPGLLGRMAAAGASLRLTLYPHRRRKR